MNITPEQIAYKKKVGRIGQAPVYEMITKGGLNMIIAARNGKVEPLGVGPHRAVSRHIAEKMEPKIEWLELSKSDHVYYQDYAWLLPQWEQVTVEAQTEWAICQEA